MDNMNSTQLVEHLVAKGKHRAAIIRAFVDALALAVENDDDSFKEAIVNAALTWECPKVKRQREQLRKAVAEYQTGLRTDGIRYTKQKNES